MQRILTACCVGLTMATCALAAEKPNIIVIMADDLGYGDVSYNGATEIHTPHIDQLANEGLRFTSGYCSASTCTPTRYSFLTGNYAFRKSNTGIAPPNGPAIIEPGTETLPSLLKKAGYATAIIGKWHLGFGPPDQGPNWNGELKPGPLEIGFDYAFLLPTTNDRVPQVYVENHRVKNLDPKDPLWVGDSPPSPDHPTGITHRNTLKMDWSDGHNGTIHNGISRIGYYTGGHAARFRDEDLGDEWIKQSRQWIQTHKDGPFFLFFASHDLHVPRMPHERFQGKSKLGFRGDAILELDWCVGELMKILTDEGIANNTLVLFCSDNGPALDDGYKDGAIEKLGNHQPSGPYRGGKSSVYEGGTRTPFITWWKGRIQPGTSDLMVCTIDLPSSFASLTGVPIPNNQCRDSLNVMDALMGKQNAQARPSLVQQNNNGNRLGFRKGDWKLVIKRRQLFPSQNNSPKNSASKGDTPPELYNLSKDPHEKTNLAASHPDQLAKLIEELRAIVKDDTTP